MDDHEDDDTGEAIWFYDLGIINERKDSGRIILASVDIQIGGICLKRVKLTLSPEGEPRLILPDRRGGTTNDNKAVVFKSKGLRDRVTAECVETYRALVIEYDRLDMTQPSRVAA